MYGVQVMTEDGNDPTTIESVIAGGLAALPSAISKSALGSIGRLISGTADIPGAWLVGVKEAIEDRNYERRLMRRGMAEAAVTIGIADDAMVRRTMSRLLQEEVAKQSNRESVAHFAVEEMSTIEPNLQDGKVGQSDIDPDWMSAFIGSVEGVSRVDAQRFWGRILAKETCQPGTISEATLQVASRLDRLSSERFQRVAALSFGNVIPADMVSGSVFSDIRLLVDAGLISPAVKTGYRKNFHKNNTGASAITGRDYCITLHGPLENDVSFEAYFLSKAGDELASILPPTGEDAVSLTLAAFLPKNGIDVAIRWRLDSERKVQDPVELWRKPN
jgi:hypothetical protein